MQSTLLFVGKIALLVLLWLFIWMSIRALQKDATAASGTRSGAPELSKDALLNPKSLVILDGPIAGTTLNLRGYQDVTLGRSTNNTLVLEDDFASGSHAQLFRRGEQWFLEDLDSRNGTWMQDVRIDQPIRLHPRTEFRVGQTTIRMEEHES